MRLGGLPAQPMGANEAGNGHPFPLWGGRVDASGRVGLR
jgi:hypothetical protein